MSASTEWRDPRFSELDHLIEIEERQTKPGHRRAAGPGWRQRRRQRLAEYAAQMRAGNTQNTKRQQQKFTPEQRVLIESGVPTSFFEPPRETMRKRR